MVQSVQVCLDTRQRVLALVIAMAGTVETVVDRAIEALLTGNRKIAHTIPEKEFLINRMEMQIDEAVLAHLASRSDCEDLRFMTSVLKINKDLERMGDLASNIGRKVMALDESRQEQARSELQPMAIAASHVCRKALRALVHQDLVLAESTLDSEELVRDYRDYVFHRIRERLESGANGSRKIDNDMGLLLCSGCAENPRASCWPVEESALWWKPTPLGCGSVGFSQKPKARSQELAARSFF